MPNCLMPIWSLWVILLLGLLNSSWWNSTPLWGLFILSAYHHSSFKASWGPIHLLARFFLLLLSIKKLDWKSLSGWKPFLFQKENFEIFRLILPPQFMLHTGMGVWDRLSKIAAPLQTFSKFENYYNKI